MTEKDQEHNIIGQKSEGARQKKQGAWQNIPNGEGTRQNRSTIERARRAKDHSRNKPGARQNT
eukprot:6039825-Pyramimonas_sp.AAC.1